MLARFYDSLKDILFSKCGHMKNQILIWKDRSRARHMLSRMTEKDLWDIGTSRADAHKEINKRFWQP
jgi:uncharacterized protein YjiS (DUF1127 family)